MIDAHTQDEASNKKFTFVETAIKHLKFRRQVYQKCYCKSSC